MRLDDTGMRTDMNTKGIELRAEETLHLQSIEFYIYQSSFDGNGL